MQYVIRPQTREHQDHRSYAGTVASGVMRPGDEVVVLPTGKTSRITAIEGPNGPVDEAFPPMAVSVSLADDIDISRGDMIARPTNAPRVTQEFDATVCWMADADALEPGRDYLIKHTTRTTRARVTALDYRLDVNTLRRDKDATALKLNELGRVIAALPGAAAARRVHPQRQHRVVHPDRPPHQRHRRRGHGVARSRRPLRGQPQHGAARLAGDREGPAYTRPHAVVHRAFGVGQVVGGDAGRAASCSKRAFPLSFSTATTCGTV